MTKLASEGMEAWASRARERRLRELPAVARPDARAEAPVHRMLPADGRPVRHAARRLRGRHADERGAPGLRPAPPGAPGARGAGAATEEPEPYVTGPYPSETQHELSLVVARAFGASEESFRLDPTVHPFCISFATQDVRLTTRYAEDDLLGSSIFSTMHEVGHGLYEHGGDPALDRSPLATGCSSALHESQSRLWENVVGRSLPFWRWFYPQFRDGFANVLADVPLERFHRTINRAASVLIRVDADETTYGLHIILRFELEQELLFGGLATSDLPERMEREARGARRRRAAERPPRLPPGRPLVGRVVRVLPDLPARQRAVGADLGATARRPTRRLRADRARRVRRDPRVAPRAPVPARPEVHAGRDDRAGRGRPDRPRAVPRATSRTRTRRSRRRSHAAWPNRFSARARALAASTSRSRGGAAVTRSSRRCARDVARPRRRRA